MRRKSEKLFKDSVATMKSAATGVPVGLGIVSNRIIQWVNDHFYTITGYTGKEIIGRNSRILYSTKGEFERIGREFYAALLDKGIASLEARWKRKDGQIRDIFLTGSAIVPGGRFPKVVFAAVDITENKRRDRVMQEAGAHFKSIFDHASDGIVIVDRKTKKFSLWNRAMARMLGRADHELKKMTIADIHPAAALPLVRKQFDALTTGTIRAARDMPVLNKAGETMFADISIAKLEFGGKRYIAGFFRDITRQKKAEERIRSSEERFRRFSAASGYGFAMGELNGQLVFGNPAICRIVEEKREEDFTRKTFYQYYTQEDAERLRKEILPVVLAKGQWVGELPLLSARGNVVQTEQNIFLIPDSHGKARMVGNIITNITERKRTIEERDRLFDNSIDMLCVADFNGHFKQINPAFQVTLGWTRDVFLAKSFMAFVHPDDQEATRRIMQKLSAGERVVAFENRYRCKDGSYKWISWNAFPLMKEKLIFTVARDVTETRALDDTKRELTRAVSHELKTPIGMSKMALDMFREAISKGDETRMQEARVILEKNVERLDKDVENILELFAIESMGKLVRKSRCSVKAVITKVVERARHTAEHKKLKLRTALSPAADDVVMVYPDLKTIIANMVDNAIKFTSQGSVTIQTKCRGRWIDIMVTDTGIGMQSEEKSKAFTQYYKGHPSMPGAGLGLAISRNIVTRYGGTIALESKGLGRGTRVVATLPRANYR